MLDRSWVCIWNKTTSRRPGADSDRSARSAARRRRAAWFRAAAGGGGPRDFLFQIL